MEDFYSIAIGLGLGVAVCGIVYLVRAFCALLTQTRDNASDEHGQHLGIGGGGFFHNGQGSTPGER